MRPKRRKTYRFRKDNPRNRDLPLNTAYPAALAVGCARLKDNSQYLALGAH